MSSFWVSFGNVLNIAGDADVYVPFGDGFSDDANALGGDWRAVGDDIRAAAEKINADDAE